MSEIMRFTSDKSGYMLGQKDGGWVRYTDHQAEIERLTSTRDAAQAEVERLTVERDTAYISIESLRNALADHHHELDIAREDVLRLTSERDMARAEVRRLIAERDQPESRPKGRERGRFGWDGHYLYGMEPARPSDEDIWREIFLQCISDYITADRRVIVADTMLAEYRKRWPR